MKRKAKVRHIKRMLHQRAMERGYYLIDVTTQQLTRDAQQELYDHAREVVDRTPLFPKKVKRADGVCTVMFIDGNV